MSKSEIDGLLEAGFGLLLVGIALAVIIDSLSLPVSVREPLGSATLPQVVSALVIAFSLAVIYRGARSFQRARHARLEADTAGEAREKRPYRVRMDMGLTMLLLATVYVALMQTRAISSVVLTPMFLLLGFVVLNDYRARAVVPAIVVAVVVGLATHFIFLDFFYVDLP